MRKTTILCGLLCAAICADAADLSALKWRTTRFAKIENGVLTVDVPPGREREGGAARATVDLREFSGRGFNAKIVARGERITEPAESWNGLKFMLSYVDTATGDRHWPNTSSRLGDFPKQEIFMHDLDGRKMETGELTLGLQSSSGKVVFDLSTLEIVPGAPLAPQTNENYRVSYPQSLLDTPLLRGVMLPGGPCREDDFKTLKEWGATLARYQMTRDFLATGKYKDLAEYDRWLDGKLEHLERQVLPWAAKYGIRIVVDLHVPPGGRDGDKSWSMYHNAEYAAHFVDCWKRIATRFKGRREIFGLDLINEPAQTRPALPECDYWSVQDRAARAIREIDPDATIIVESNGWDSADAFATLSPLALDNVIYQVHMYQPHQFTHQGVGVKNENYRRCAYPNAERKWDKEFIRARLAPVREFQRRHNVRIYVGEFSAITWAEGADRYIADCIDVFEEYGWDWTYHAFREWSGWSVEHEAVGWRKFAPSSDNPRRRALLDGLGRGTKPSFRGL